jgi:hypothetical protein
MIALVQGNQKQARARLVEALEIGWQLGAEVGWPIAVGAFGQLAPQQGEQTRALRFLGAADAAPTVMASPVRPTTGRATKQVSQQHVLRSTPACHPSVAGGQIDSPRRGHAGAVSRRPEEA